MASSKQIITSLLTEHFRYTPLTLVDDIINLVNELVYRAVTAVEEGLNGTSPQALGFAERATDEGRTPEKDDLGNAVYPEAKIEIEHGVHQLETLLEATVDKNFDKLEIYVLRNILTVPDDLAPWIKLKHYKNLEFTSKTNEPTPDDLQILRRKYQETQRLHNALVEESSRNKQLIIQLQSLLQRQPQNGSSAQDNLAFLTNSPSAIASVVGDPSIAVETPITAQAQFAVSQLPQLKQLLATLREKADSIKAPRGTDEAAKDRRDYIEAQVRQGLERGGAVDVQTGDGLGGKAGLGPSVDAEDVRGIEGVVGTFDTDNGAIDKMEE